MISNQSLGCIKGDNAVFEIDMNTEAGPVDLTGAGAQWILAESWFDGASIFLTKTTGLSGGVTITNDAGTWKVIIQLSPSDTLNIPSGLMFHECKLTLSDASVAHVASGPFVLEPSLNPGAESGLVSRSAVVSQSLGSIGQTAAASDILALPSGAVGAWDFSRYSTLPSPHVPNSIVTTPVSANLFRASRRMFANSEWWTPVNLTVVDDAATGSDGIGDASTINGTSAGWFLHPATGAVTNIPAGTYTVGCSVKRNVGSDQPFAFTSDNTGSVSSIRTAGAAWSRESYTFTFGSTTDIRHVGICSSDGATAANIQIRDLELFGGSSDLGPLTPDGHIYLGQTAFDTTYLVPSNGAVDMSGGGYGLIQFPIGSASGNFTAQAVVSKVVDGNAYESFLSRVQAYGQFSAMADYSNRPGYNGGVFQEGGGQDVGLWKLYGAGYHVITLRYDGAQVELFLDDIRLFVDSSTPASFNLRDLFVNITGSNNLWGGLKYHGVGFWSRALSNAEVAASFMGWQSNAAAHGITLSGDTTNRIVIFEGDSRSGGFPYLVGPNANPSVFGVNMSLTGSTLANVASRQTVGQGNFPVSKNGRKFYVVIGPMGANDLAAYTGATDAIAAQNYSNALAAISDAYYGYGADKVIVSTELPQSGATTHNARRSLLNNIIKTSWPGTNSVSVADIGSDAIMGTDTSFTDHPADWLDGTHPSAAGDALLEPYYRTILNGLP